MRVTIIPLVFFLTAVIFLGSCGNVYAQEDHLGQSQIHPAHSLYFLKTVREILELKFAGTDRIKSLRRMEFSTRRIREVKALVNVQKEELIAPTLEKYGALLKDIIGTTNITEKELSTQLGESIDNHLNALYLVYETVSNPDAKRSIRLTVHRLADLNSEFIERALEHEQMINVVNLRRARQTMVCEFLQREASSSTLNQVEQGVYLKRASSCYKVLGASK